MGKKKINGERNYHFSSSEFIDAKNTVSRSRDRERERGRLRQGEVSKDSNQRQNPLNLQLSGDSADILDPSSSFPLFHSEEGSVIVIPPKVLTTNPDDPSLPPTSYL